MTDFFYGCGVARKGKERVRVRERGEEGGAKKILTEEESRYVNIITTFPKTCLSKV